MFFVWLPVNSRNIQETKQRVNVMSQVSINPVNTTINICIAKRCIYIASLNNDMFRPLYRPSSDFTVPYFEANCTIYDVFCFCQRDLVQKHCILCTSIKSAFKCRFYRRARDLVHKNKKHRILYSLL